MRVLCYISIIFFGFVARAQFSMDEFLAQSVSDIELSEVKTSLDYINNHSFKSPWIREMEIRARSNDSELGLEDYRLRFGLLNPGEQRANRAYRDQLRTTTRLRLDTDLNDVLLQRYRLAIESMRLTSMDTLLDLERQLLEIEKEIALDASDLGQAMKREDDIFQIGLESLRNQQKLKINTFLVRERLDFTGDVLLDTATFLSFQSILERIS